ncbi:hypothetical protein JI666_20405 [Bacillus sp. NTK071]|uniref:hypothetical protein n=1 Tax=Bacillus sp. NTK071 TaxID=2802175 RepID=UPI001A8F1901|nr:hypothetical protein [Bacillus sp. NTK071]MBN8211101.1 hypothetical protein [Bacillus sp. NTK071]
MLITIQCSVYHWNVMEEIIYEAQIDSIEGFIALTCQFDKRVKFKKTSDKNWYYAKTMIKRLFKNDMAKNKPIIKYVCNNDLNKIEDEA